jgi:hypothetical protein
MKIDRTTLLVIAAAFLIGYWWPASESRPDATPSRPVVRWIAKVAKNLLWVALVAEEPPKGHQPDHRIVQSDPIGEDGYPLLDNGRGW